MANTYAVVGRKTGIFTGRITGDAPHRVGRMHSKL
eukprot:gene49683-20086_t